MMQVRVTLFALALLLVLPAAASTAPEEGDMAVSFNLGVVDAFDNQFSDLETVVTGTFQYHSSPRVAWRGLFGMTTFDGDSSGNANVDIDFFNANVVYNWEHGEIHPFVTGGVGLYDRSARNLPGNFGGTELGLNGGGGIDWFLGERWALKFEGTFHGVSGEKPDWFFMATAGAIVWF